MSDLNAAIQLIKLALAEDIGKGDLTALAVPEEKRARARLIAKEDCVLSGLELPALVLKTFGSGAKVKWAEGVRDGSLVKKGSLVLELEGSARDLLTTERTILNLLQRLSGVATQASRYKAALGDFAVKILDTRKTTPGLRAWEKQAVKDGGLFNHRQRLDDGVLIKENHIRAAGSIGKALENLQGKIPAGIPVEVEVTCWEEIEEALRLGVKRLLIDNYSPEDLASTVKRIRAGHQGIYLEASGGITLENLKAYGATGVDAISIGALTHSVKAVDLSLLFEFQ